MRKIPSCLFCHTLISLILIEKVLSLVFFQYNLIGLNNARRPVSQVCLTKKPNDLNFPTLYSRPKLQLIFFMKKALFFIFPLIQLIYGGKPISDSQEDELVFLQGVWRHGDRSPTRTFKTDPYKESSWPQGFGQLSAVGL